MSASKKREIRNGDISANNSGYPNKSSKINIGLSGNEYLIAEEEGDKCKIRTGMSISDFLTLVESLAIEIKASDNSVHMHTEFLTNKTEKYYSRDPPDEDMPIKPVRPLRADMNPDSYQDAVLEYNELLSIYNADRTQVVTSHRAEYNIYAKNLLATKGMIEKDCISRQFYSKMCEDTQFVTKAAKSSTLVDYIQILMAKVDDVMQWNDAEKLRLMKHELENTKISEKGDSVLWITSMKRLANQLLEAQVENYRNQIEPGLDDVTINARIDNYRKVEANRLDNDANIIDHMYKEFKHHGATIPIEKAMQTFAEAAIVKEGECPYIPKPGRKNTGLINLLKDFQDYGRIMQEHEPHKAFHMVRANRTPDSRNRGDPPTGVSDTSPGGKSPTGVSASPTRSNTPTEGSDSPTEESDSPTEESDSPTGVNN